MSWYCSFSLVFQCETVLSLIFSENTDIDCMGELQKPFIFKLMGGFLAYVKIKSTFFLCKLRMVVFNEKMSLNHVFTIQTGLEGQYTLYINRMGAWGHIFALFIKFYTEKCEFSLSCLVTSEIEKVDYSNLNEYGRLEITHITKTDCFMCHRIIFYRKNTCNLFFMV